MKTSPIDFSENVLDSRDIIARFEELRDDYDTLVSEMEEAQEALAAYLKTTVPEYDGDEMVSLEEAREEATANLEEFNNSWDKDELIILTKVVEQGEDCGDWKYGETLIKEDYFTEYTKHLVEDCYELPKEFDSGTWPYRHMEMNWDDAAGELMADYTEIDCGENTYYIRS